MTDLVMMKDVQEKLRRFRENPLSARPPTLNEITVMQFPCEFNKPIEQLSVFVYNLNVLIEKFEKLNRYEEIDFLLDAFNYNQKHEIYLCLFLAQHGRLDAVIKVIGLLKNNRMREFYEVSDRLNLYGLEDAIRYLNTIFHQPATLNELSVNDARLNQILSYTGTAGMRLDQQQDVNKKAAESFIDIYKEEQKTLNKANIGLAEKRSTNDEEMRVAREKAEIVTTTGVNPFSQSDVAQIDFFNLEKDFIVEFHLVRVEHDGDPEVYRWDESAYKYVAFSTLNALEGYATSYVYKKCGPRADFSDTDVNKMVRRLRYETAPILGKPGAPKVSNEMQVFFPNGYYDLRAKCFCPMDTTRYFHLFCMPFPYQEQAGEPSIFESICLKIFEGDDLKLKLAYQIIGAIISHVNLKHVFVFQGEKHGGKTTLMKCIRMLFYSDETKSVGSMREISDGKGFRTEKKVRLLTVDDAPSEKWNDNVVSYLKTRSSGTSDESSAGFKILLNTNYPITMKTADGRDSSIDTRIIVLPFDKDLKEAGGSDPQSIKDYFENQYEEERPGIVKKALEAFDEVLQNNETFSPLFSLNAVVSGSNNVGIVVASEERENLLFRIVNENFDFVDSDQFLAEPKTGMLAKHVYNYINGEQPNLVSRPAELSKQLKNLFSKQFASREYADKTYFNLRLKD